MHLVDLNDHSPWRRGSNGGKIFKSSNRTSNLESKYDSTIDNLATLIISLIESMLEVEPFDYKYVEHK